MEGMVNAVGHGLYHFRDRGFNKTFAVLGGKLAVLVNLQYIQISQVIEYRNISVVAGSDGTVILQTEISCGVEGACLDRKDRIDTLLYGFTDNSINVTVTQKIARMLVIGDQHDPLCIWSLKQWKKGIQIVGGSTLTNHDPLTTGKLLLCFVCIGAFMIGADACSNIAV